MFCAIQKIYFSERGVFGGSWRFIHFFLAIEMRARFGDCLLDSETHELFRRDAPVHLTPKAFQLLELLLGNRPRVVSKAEIHEKVWPGTFVSEATLASVVSDIRATIGGGARDSRFIRTVHGVGYAFSGEAKVLGPVGHAPTRHVEWRLIWENREIALSEGENLLGRDHESAVWIDSKDVSRHHARILIDGDLAILEDLGSKNGTNLEGRQITAPSPLTDGDEIAIAQAVMTVRAFREGGTTRTRSHGNQGGSIGEASGKSSRRAKA